MENKASAVLNEVGKVILGKDDVVAKVYMAILAGGSILLEDVPGVGKTTLALAFKNALGLDYRRVQFTPDSTPSDIIGFSVYDSNKNVFEYRPGAAMTNLLLADEINRTSTKTQSALLEVMEEGNVTVDGQTREVPKPFIVIATQNPVGSAGTQMLPHSQLDRFMIRLEMGYPDYGEEVEVLRERHSSNPLDDIVQASSVEELLQMQAEVQNVHVEDTLYEYITRLARATRDNELIQLGLSPRGSLALARIAKAHAYVSGRDYLVPEDVTALFTEVCAHRIVLYPKARIAEMTAEQILEDILAKTPRPEIKG